MHLEHPQDGRGLPHEHPAVPQIVTVLEERPRHVRRRLLHKSIHLVHGIAAHNFDLVSEMDVPVSRLRPRWHDPDRRQSPRTPDRGRRCPNRICEALTVLDEMIRGQHDHHPIRIRTLDMQRHKPDTRGRTAPARLPDHLLRRKLRNLTADLLRVAGLRDDQHMIEQSQTTRAVHGLLQHRPVPTHRKELLGPMSSAQRPRSRAPATCHNYSVHDTRSPLG